MSGGAERASKDVPTEGGGYPDSELALECSNRNARWSQVERRALGSFHR